MSSPLLSTEIDVPDARKLHELPDECILGILGYCDNNTLCALDATCRLFQDRTDVVWESLARERFGITKSLNHYARYSEEVGNVSGKTIWAKGLALLGNGDGEDDSSNVVVVALADPSEYITKTHQDGDPATFDRVVTNVSSSVIAYSIDNFLGGTFEPLCGSDPIFLRDSSTLSFIKSYSLPFGAWNHAICGPSGC